MKMGLQKSRMCMVLSIENLSLNLSSMKRHNISFLIIKTHGKKRKSSLSFRGRGNA